MKKLILIAIVAAVFASCNNSEDGNDPDNVYTPSADSIPGTRDGDTSSYERMPNRISDTIQQ